MAQLTTTHDKELNQKVFKLRGDEGYTKETKILISIPQDAEYDINTTGYLVPIDVSVLRGVGASNLVVYDGDNAIQIFEWSATESNPKRIMVGRLSYDMDHKITVKYMGNTQCLRSLSNDVIAYKENTLGHPTTFTIQTGSWTSVSDTINLRAKLSDTTDDSPVTGKTVYLYIDGESKGSTTTQSTGGNLGRASFDGIDDLDSGKHHVAMTFLGSDETEYAYLSSTKEWDISIGKDINITSFPSMILAHQPITVTGESKDWNGNFVTQSSTYYFADKTITGNTTGELSFTNVSGLVNGTEYAITDAYGNTSQTVTANVVTVSGITATTDYATVHPQMTATITIQVSGDNIQKGIPVVVNGGGYDNQTFTTDYRGTIKVKYTGNTSHDGEVTITATCGSYTDSVTIENLLFYYGNEMPTYAPMTPFGYNIVKKTDGISLPIPSNGNFVAIGIGEGSTTPIGDYELIFDMVSDRYQVVFNQGSFANGLERYGATPWSGAGDWMQMPTGSKIKIVRTGSTIKTYRKQRNESAFSLMYTRTDANPTQGLYPVFYASYSGTSWYMKQGEFKINNIKLKKISE